MLAHGCALGWFSPALPLLTSENTPLESGPFTTEHTSWSGSILSLGGIAGNILFGYMMVRVGTKHTIMSFAVPQAVSEAYSVLISNFCNNSLLLLRFHGSSSISVWLWNIYTFPDLCLDLLAVASRQ